jgi:gliding motility-associated protein GldM
MINMMYLVLMAMLALNVSKEVLVAFGRINESIQTTSTQLHNGTKILYGGLADKANTNPEKYGPKNDIALSIKSETTKAITIVNEIIAGLEKSVGGRDPETGELPWKEMDGSNGDEFLFPGGSPKAGKGQYLTDGMTDYRNNIISTLKKAKATKGVMNVSDEEFKTFITDIDETLSTDDYDNKGTIIPWVKHKFEHYPVASAIAFLTQMKADIRNTEFRAIRRIAVKGQGTTVNQMIALPIAKSSTVMKGGKFEAQLRLAGYDTTAVPEMYVWKTDKNGKQVGKQMKIEVDGGAGVVQLPANSIGTQFWGGIIKVKDDDGKVTEYPFDGEYNVAQPAVVVSAEKMNVLYRGVENPVSISVPGVSSNKITVSAPGAKVRSLGNGRYSFNVTQTKGTNVKIVVTAVMPDGHKQSFPGQTYRVKGLPSPEGNIAGKNEVKLPKANIKVLPIQAELKNFDFDLKLKVVSFTLKIPGKPSIRVVGNKMNAQAKKAIDKARGEIYIRDIKAKIVGKSTYRIGRVSPITIQVL